METGKVWTTQQSSFEPQLYRIARTIFIAFGALALLVFILGIIYLLLNFSLIRILEQTKIPLALLFAAGLSGIWDLLLWIPVSSVFTPSTSSSLSLPFQQADQWRNNTALTNPQYPPEQDRGNSHATSGHLPMDPNAMDPPLNDLSSWVTSDLPTENMVTAIPDSQFIPHQAEDQSLTALRPQYGEEKSAGIIPSQRVKGQEGAQTFRFFAVPREGDNLERSADKSDYNQKDGRYALADGVSDSFLPGRWAEIVTKSFVERENDFENREDAIQWQKDCSKQWHMWFNQNWLPQAVAASGQPDWSRDLARGAATTFAGCSFSPSELASSDATTIHVTVVGDTEFFLLSPTGNESMPWSCNNNYYRLHLEDFGHMTENLATPERRVERDYKWMHHKYFYAKKGECIVLATDALAQWILQQMQDGKDPWIHLLSISTPEGFKQFVRNARNIDKMEVDDTTLMIIPLR